MRQLTLPAPAKLNLFLHITGRRSDGYHNLQTLFQLLDYGDELQFRLRDDGQLSLSPEIPGLPAADNLVIKAARLLQATGNSSLGADILLDKKLPQGGGIGGGSSDAATTLLALNRLWKLGLDLEHLEALGQRLGADVPVFVRGRTAWAEGTGERLQPLDLAPRWYLVIAPECHVSTAAVFSHKDLTRDTLNITVAAFLEQGGRNDCQPLVRRLYPPVDRALNWLDQYGHAQITGTGACVFTSFSNEARAKAVLQELPPDLNGFVARGVNQSGAHKLLSGF